MLLTGEVFNPCDLKKIDMPPEKRDATQRKAIREAKRFLLSLGIVDLSEASA
jgi:hypothetical protein